ncbi:MAG: hypothetical protein LBB52_04040 [Desulfovibrio sp.]|jgi:hypothetical protein|nr:hypothetical protein [Desulfovibrio sp.]
MKPRGLLPVFPGKGVPALIVFSLLLALASCASPGGKKPEQAAAPEDPRRQNLAYDLSLMLPDSWTIANRLPPENNSRDSLDQRRKDGKPIALLGATAPAPAKGNAAVLAVFLSNDRPYFMPREMAEKMKPEDFSRLSRDMLEKETADAKKRKARAKALDIKISRETLGGHLAVLSNILRTDDKGIPFRVLIWNVYLPNGAGITLHAECDPDDAAAERDITDSARTLKIR